jgi:hypothetical protein
MRTIDSTWQYGNEEDLGTKDDLSQLRPTNIYWASTWHGLKDLAVCYVDQ